MLDEDLIRYFSNLIKEGFYGDIRLNETDGTSIIMENGIVRSVSETKSGGFGLRLLKGGVWAFSSSDDMTKAAIKKSVDYAYKVLRSKPNNGKGFKITPQENNAVVKPNWRLDTRGVGIKDKLDVVKRADKAAMGRYTVSTRTIYGDGVSSWMVGSNIGNIVSFSDSAPRLLTFSFVKDGSSVQYVRKSIGANTGFELFDGNVPEKLGSDAKKESNMIRNAKQVKGGKYDVVLDYSMTGTYTHEAFGHASEADGILEGASVLEGKLEKKVGNEIVNIIDDPTLKDRRGSFSFDQEGTRAERRIIVENGVLKNYLHTLETASRLNAAPNGAARAMNYKVKPIARMSNTLIAQGDFEEDIFEGIEKGVMFYGFQYGYVDPGSGKFMFKAQYGRMIRHGKLAEFVRDAALTGSTLDILNRIDAISKYEFDLDDGTCGKEGQWVSVGTGGPNIRIKGVVVGGQ
jgi:TldD protein